MRTDVLAADLTDIRGADSNSLLRMDDAAREIAAGPGTLQQRSQAERALRRISQELRRRGIAP
jgi:hypothetical protein